MARSMRKLPARMGDYVTTVLARHYSNAQTQYLPLASSSTDSSPPHPAKGRLLNSKKAVALGTIALSLSLVLFAFAWRLHPDLADDAFEDTTETHEADTSYTGGLGKDAFISSILQDPIEGVVDPVPIQKKCAETEYHQGLVWHCEEISGGIGNANNMFLNCVRYAIEAGATTLILPRIGARDQNLIDFALGAGVSEPLSVLFDVDHFLANWKIACPQMRAVVSDAELDPPPPPLSLSPNLTTAHVDKFDMVRGLLIVDPSGWRPAFERWLAKYPQYFANMSAQTPTRVWQKEALFQWNNKIDDPDFVRSLARLFRFPEPTRRLAGAVLWGLAQKLQRPVRVGGLGDAGHHLVPDAFFGSHLRVAVDAVKAGFQGYDSQAPFYITEARKRNFSDIYLATGSPPHLDTFRQDAARENMTVYTKTDLLTPSELAELNQMNWDQQALVDLDVLLHSSFFFGFCRSSFSWQVAMRRAAMKPDAGTRKTGDALAKEETYRDDISAIVVHHDVDFFRSVWP